MTNRSDIDIDLGNRDNLLALIKHIPASIRKKNLVKKHPTGVYITDIPYDPINNMSSIDYEVAEERGYFKLDLLNVHLYNKVRDEQHLNELMIEPNWNVLNDRNTVEQLIHINNQYDTLQRMPEPINSIPRLAMFLAVIRPSKRHLIGKSYKEINDTVWDKDSNGYSFKKSHAIAYAHLVVVNMNLLEELGHTFNESNTTPFNSSFV
jgi:hypothetical protein